MFMSKYFKICGILAIAMLWACSDDESPTSINAGQSLLEPNDSSSSSAELEALVAESSSATVENLKKSKFVEVEFQGFANNSQGELYLGYEMVYSDYKILSDSSATYEYTSTSYNEDGTVSDRTITKASQQGTKTISKMEKISYDYSTGEQKVLSKSSSELEEITEYDEDINYASYQSSRLKLGADDEQTNKPVSAFTMTKEFVGETEKGRKYILHNKSNDRETSRQYAYVDSDGFITELSSDDPDASTYLYDRLPNAPESLSKSTECGRPLVDEGCVYEYYNLSCEDVVNTADEYKLVVKHSYKFKYSNEESITEMHYTFKRFEY